MLQSFSSFDFFATDYYDKQERYKKKYDINALYKSFTSPLIWDYNIECFVTYLPFMLEYQKISCNPRDIINKHKIKKYMEASRNGYTIIDDDDVILTDYIDNYFISKYQGTVIPSFKNNDKLKFKKYFNILDYNQVNDTFNEIIDNEKRLKYKIITSLKNYIKNDVIIIKKSRYSPKMDYKHIKKNLYVKNNNISIKIEA